MSLYERQTTPLRMGHFDADSADDSMGGLHGSIHLGHRNFCLEGLLRRARHFD
jgi:hypothetical protein